MLPAAVVIRLRNLRENPLDEMITQAADVSDMSVEIPLSDLSRFAEAYDSGDIFRTRPLFIFLRSAVNICRQNLPPCWSVNEAPTPLGP